MTLERFGRYEILHKLGAGGMAETYVAVRRGPGGFAQRVCLKRIRRDATDDPDLQRQFLAEARLAAELRHATLTQVLDFGEEGGEYFLALELVGGVDLRKLLGACGTLPPHLTWLVLSELATALDVVQRASERGIVHRDVSPANVLLSTEGEVKLTDFGIARAQRDDQHTRTGIIKGKVPYLAPEYARSGLLDARCDLFALGVIAFECLAGQRPYDGATDLDTLERAARGDHAPLAPLAPAAPAPLVAITERLLEPDPELRFQSAAELLAALEGMPAAPGARRDLAARVLALVPPEPEDATAEETRPLGGLAPTRTTARPPRRLVAQAPRLALAASLSIAAGVAGAWLLRPAAAPPAARPARDARPSRAPAAEQARAPAPAATAPELVTTGTLEPAATDEKQATLVVSVLPYGDVWVDGRSLGRSPVTARVRPGERRITASRDGKLLERVVQIRAGELRRVLME